MFSPKQIDSSFPALTVNCVGSTIFTKVVSIQPVILSVKVQIYYPAGRLVAV